MSDPRAGVRYTDIGYRAETFKIDDSTITYDATKANGSSQVGLAVRLTTGIADTIELVGDGEDVLGKLISVDKDNFAVVQTKGYATLPGGSGATLTIGEKIVGDLGAAAAEGYIRAVATGTAAELGHARGRIVNAGTTTAVVVDLG